MADNKGKTDRLHDLLPKHFQTKVNPNWKALVETIGQSDEYVAELIEEVRKQFFVKTATRPYIDRLGANVKVSRPKLIGMDDSDFRRYIPVVAYQPKQVKLIIDQLLDIFFLKESTTAYIDTIASDPYFLKDGWELEYTVDSFQSEKILFTAADFEDISAATATEIVAAINRQATKSFAIVYTDNFTKLQTVRIFTETVGAKGAVMINGGRANISLQFRGFDTLAGSGVDTKWVIVKVGDTVTFTYNGGTWPSLESIQVGDVVVIDIPNNEGSFAIISIDLATSSFTFTNASAVSESFDHASYPNTFVRFFTPEKTVVFTEALRAIAWEVRPGQIVIEMPASPPIVKRQLGGSSHINGLTGLAVNRTSDTELQLSDASDWPDNGGCFVFQPLNEIQTHIKTNYDDLVTIKNFASRYNIQDYRFTYTGKNGNILTGISPTLPKNAGIFETNIVSGSRDNNDTITVVTTNPHDLSVGEPIRIRDTISTSDIDPDLDLMVSADGTFRVAEVVDDLTFKYRCFGDVGAFTGGVVMVERVLTANSGSTVHLVSARLETGILGPYIWDLRAPFVLSSLVAVNTTDIKAGSTQRNISVNLANSIPDQEGYLIFDYGTDSQEGPVRMLYKASDTTLAVDPAYVFLYDHDIGSSITMIRRRGAHQLSISGKEYAPYITDPASARDTLKTLINQVKSAGIFLEFIIRYPVQYYATEDVYRVGKDPG